MGSDVGAPTSAGRSVAEVPWHALAVDEVARHLGTGPAGLGEEDARSRLARWGPNRLEEEPPPAPWLVFLRQFANPLILILVVAAGVTAALGEVLDTCLIAVALLLNAVVGFVQEQRATSAVRALKGLVVPRSRVVRAGKEREVDSRELVPGDLVRLEPGTRVPADLRLSETNQLTVDESLLTGESLPTIKSSAPVGEAAPATDRASMAFTGTTVTSGRGSGYVVATGRDTELGVIAGLMREEDATQAPLHARLETFARVIGVSVLVASAVTFASGLALGESADHMFHTAVAMAVSAVPEGLPVAVTITLAIGVTRMARRKAVIRRLAAVETLGSATVVGSDKTGTLTENRMTVETVWAAGRTVSPNPGLDEGDPARTTLLAGVLTNEARVHIGPDGVEFVGDPTEVALLEAAYAAGIEPRRAREDSPLLADIPFEPERRWSASLRTYKGLPTAFLKGAPEDVIGMCDRMLTDAGAVPIQPALVHEAARRLATDGQRVLAMAYRSMPDDEKAAVEFDRWGTGQPPAPAGLTLLGLQGMLDPPREGVSEAIDACRAARVRVLMITGDHAATARAIAVRLGIADSDEAEVVTGADLVEIGDDELRELVTRVSVFARMSPRDKLRIVRCLHELEHIVAVTGDGVNDAPALRAAAIGVAMGRSGTDVAREASDMVLSDDNFVSIVAALEEGRVAFANIRKVSFFLISTALAETVAIMATVWLGWPLLLVPAQILWLNLVTNGVQDVALAFEPGSPDVLRRPPRPRGEGILSRTLWERTAVTGLVMAVGALVMFRWELDRSGSLASAQTVALTTLVVFNVLQVGNARSESRSLFALSPFSNRFLFVATLAAVTLHAAALHWSSTQYVLGVVPIDLEAWRNALLVGTSILVASEVHKAVRRRWPAGGARNV